MIRPIRNLEEKPATWPFEPTKKAPQDRVISTIPQRKVTHAHGRV